MKPNNITRLLDSHSIDYSIFELPKEKLGAIETAKLLNVSPNIVFKSIVLKRLHKGKLILAVVPGSKEVDKKALAKFLYEKKITACTLKEAEQFTKLKTGGISPLALINHNFDIVLDKSALNYNQIHISGGQRGVIIKLSPRDLINLTKAKVAQISK